MGGKGPEYLRVNFKMLAKQTFTDFEVVVSDQSRTDSIKRICDEYRDRLDIRYVRNENYGNGSDNTNTALKNATGKIIKILFLDDYLYSEKSLEDIVTAFDTKKYGWIATSCTTLELDGSLGRIHHAAYDDATILFKNGIGPPSVVAMLNGDPVLFDLDLSWSQDIDFYKRCYARYGQPQILDTVTAVIRIHEHQMTNTTATERNREEQFRHILAKWKIPNADTLLSEYRRKRYIRQFKNVVKHILHIHRS